MPNQRFVEFHKNMRALARRLAVKQGHFAVQKHSTGAVGSDASRNEGSGRPSSSAGVAERNESEFIAPEG